MLGREGDDSGAAGAAGSGAAVVVVAAVVVAVADCTRVDKQRLKIQQTPGVCFLPKARGISLETCRLQK